MKFFQMVLCFMSRVTCVAYHTSLRDPLIARSRFFKIVLEQGFRSVQISRNLVSDRFSYCTHTYSQISHKWAEFVENHDASMSGSNDWDGIAFLIKFLCTVVFKLCIPNCIKSGYAPSSDLFSFFVSHNSPSHKRLEARSLPYPSIQQQQDFSDLCIIWFGNTREKKVLYIFLIKI